MPRGSTSTSSSSTPTGTVVEMQGESGQLNSQGKVRIVKKYFVQKDSDLSKVPKLDGYRATQVTYNKMGVGYEQNVEYSAQIDSAQAPGIVEKLDGLEGSFEMFTSYETIPIELHPKIDKLSRDFSGYFTPDGFAKWPPFYQPSGGGGLGGGDLTRNPMFGVTRYKEVSMTFRHTCYKKSISRSIYDRAGKVVTSLPAGFPTPPGPKDGSGRELKRRWMMQMPAISREGEAYRVVQDYVLLDTSGIADGLYDTASTPGAA